MAITISAEDQRSIKAVEIAANAGQWLKCRGADGSKRYGVPSQTAAGLYYLVDLTSCTCPDAQRHQPESFRSCMAEVRRFGIRVPEVFERDRGRVDPVA